MMCQQLPCLQKLCGLGKSGKRNSSGKGANGRKLNLTQWFIISDAKCANIKH